MIIQAQIKEKIKGQRHWHFRGEFTGDRFIPRKKTSNAENVSIWWRHQEFCSFHLSLSLCHTSLIEGLSHFEGLYHKTTLDDPYFSLHTLLWTSIRKQINISCEFVTRYLQ